MCIEAISEKPIFRFKKKIKANFSKNSNQSVALKIFFWATFLPRIYDKPLACFHVFQTNTDDGGAATPR